MVKYCADRGGKVLESQWTKAKDLYHFKCGVPDHPVFVTSADALYSGEHWCPYCSGRSGDFQTELEAICKEKNGELISNYNGAGEYVRVKCNKHNYVWNILPGNIKKGRWCPICNMGFNEKVVYDYLVNMHCNFKIQYTFDDLIGDNNEKLRFDFAIFSPSNSLICLIEIDDEEHRDDHSGNTPRQISRQKAVERDNIKNKYCKNNDITLYRIQVPFRNFNKWSYNDYYKYVSVKLKDIVEVAMKEIKC
nr:hypothetical protein [Clostridium sp. AM45-5]